MDLDKPYLVVVGLKSTDGQWLHLTGKALDDETEAETLYAETAKMVSEEPLWSAKA